jgi:MinD superfamily P-loop ATPase
VDAANLHLLMHPRVEHSEDFVGGNQAWINPERCVACGKCRELCRFEAIRFDGPGNERVPQTFRVDPLACEGCGVCAHFCCTNAIDFAPAVCGQWFRSATRGGPMVHARMLAGAENSGKLVTLIRRQARQIAERQRRELILCDGSPGIGCPVIASLTGAHLALIVAEPTVAGLHDFRRIAELTQQLNIPGLLVVNKADLNESLASKLEAEAAEQGLSTAERVPYDITMTQAQLAGRAVVEICDGPASRAIKSLWSQLQHLLKGRGPVAEPALVQLQTS